MRFILPVCLAAALVFAAFRVCADETVAITPDVVYGHKDGLAMTFDVLQPKQNANGTGVLFMVSGGWRSHWVPPEQAWPMFKPLLDRGFTVFVVRHGSSPRYNIPEVVGDVRRSVRFIRLHAKQYGVAPEYLGVYGGSAGGHLSLMLGTTSDDGLVNSNDPVLQTSDRVAAVVALFPPTDLRAWVTDEENNYNKDYPALRFPTARAGDYSPLLHVTSDDPPTLLVHGDKDRLVPLAHSENILAEFKKHETTAELLVIQGAGHGFTGPDGKRASDALVAWFETHLVEKKKQANESN